ncbi:molybdopterin-dependent oxidoreductase [Parahaliea maris]|uniref:Molybdopterin-dependent oxidoreductase n=1 Tax=Parahaliea maris TaxID=2716870 RepID=A0A5C9A951_9GAMM|nr:molybdopterin-dependent oxidoreductase [Parahaliea maris]TXS96170.1 molybdopterin-dependent oxidoreductase [Parahaliea maris]
MGTTTQKTFCRICEAQCGLQVTTENNRVLNIAPNPDHVSSRGYACIKGLKMGDFAGNPDRLTRPLKKVDGSFQPIPWEQALTEIGDRLKAIHEQHGGESIAAYIGNPIAFSMWPTTLMTGFLKAFDADKLFTPGTQDCANKFAGAERMFGSASDQVFPDIDHTRLLIVVGSNPVISKMSFICLPHAMDRVADIEQRGGKVYWVNPRFTESAKRCGEHIPIRPDTDVFFFLGFLHEMIARNAVDQERVQRYMEGYEALAAAARPWTPERVEAVTRIPAERLRDIVTQYVEADGAAIYSSTGVNQGRFGLLAFWLQEAINAISGNLDRRGGVIAGKGVIAKPPAPGQVKRSRIADVPYVNSTVPGGILADEILNPGPGKVRAMLNMSGNPLLTCAGSERLAAAFSDLELFVCLDIVRNETAEYADYILPGLHALERADIPFYFFTVMGLMPDRSFSYTDSVLSPPGDARDEGLILRQLCRAAGRPLGGSRPLQWLSNLGEWLNRTPLAKSGMTLDRLFFSLLMRSGKISGIRAMRKHPDGILLTPNQPGDYLGQRVNTPSGKVQLAPPDLIARLDSLETTFNEELEGAPSLKLIQKRERFSHNTWAHNVTAFVKGERNTNYLYIHPQDAAAHQLTQDSIARVSANGKYIDVPVKFDDSMMPGAVAVPHGWGHQRADGLSVARQTNGANINVIMPDGPGSIEPLSGMSHMNGVVVTVSPVPPDMN